MMQIIKLVGTTLAGSMLLAVAATQFRTGPENNANILRPSSSQQTMAKVQQTTTATGNSATLFADSRGHFFANIQVRGAPIKMLVDTGASLVALSAEDANKIGIRTAPNDRKAQFSTANGIVTATLVRLPEISLQGITVFDVDAAIMPPGALKGSLLGMSFMNKLSSFESRGVSMVLRK
jgi:aspartyl protease family protein